MTAFRFGYRETVSSVLDPRDPWGRWEMTAYRYERCDLDHPEAQTVEDLAAFWEELSQDGRDWTPVFGEGRETLEFSV